MDLSSSSGSRDFENRFGLIKGPEAVSDRCKKATIPLPYHIPNENLDILRLKHLETRCLKFLERKLLLSKIHGEQYKALLMEYILTGNGGELSRKFLCDLGKLLKRFDVIIIADEIMTGGRVGPGLTMTLTQPQELKERVKFITLGKVYDCGITLQSIDYEIGTEHTENLRGMSTELELGVAYANLCRIESFLLANSIEVRQKQLLKSLKLNIWNKEKIWGQGLLLFSSKARVKVREGLKHRYLTQLEVTRKIRLGSLKDSDYTSSWMNTNLSASIEQWLEMFEKNPVEVYQEPCSKYSQFLLAVADYSLAKTEFTGYFGVEEILDFVGKRRASDIEANFKKRKIEEQGPLRGRCCKNVSNLFHEALRDAIDQSSGYVNRVRKCKKRRLFYTLGIHVSKTEN